MSGIFGLYNNMKRSKDCSIESMRRWNRLYGDGKELSFEDVEISMGCCVDIMSERYGQDSSIIQVNGKYGAIDAVIYNRDELITLCGAEQNVSDSKLLLIYITTLGYETLENVNGDFAGAIYDKEKHELVLFRDHMGVRPLYIYGDNDIVAFSTDLRGLVSLPIVDSAVSEEWIYQTISGFANENAVNTPFEKIRCIAPASFEVYSFAKAHLKHTQKQYWKLGRHKIRKKTFEDYTKSMRLLVEDSVKRRTDAVTGPIGAELSGGLDSGVIDILINRVNREGIYYSWSPNPKDVEYAENDERLIINDICNSENIICNYAQADANYSARIFEKMSDCEIKITDDGSDDFKFAFMPNSNTYSILAGASFAHSKGAKVMFTGHGGDEGVSHRMSVYEMFYNHEYSHYLRYIWSITKGPYRVFRTLQKGWKNIFESAKSSHESFVSWYSSPELLKSDFAKRFEKQKQARLDFSYDPIAYIESGGSRNRLDNLALFGALSGIRYMIPYLDYRVIDYAVSIPRYLYIRGSLKRYIFREAFKDIMPESLYKVKIKEDTSHRKIKPNDEWYEPYAARKAEIISSLDMGYWSKYLDFGIIDELLNHGKPTDEEYEVESRQLKVLLNCALAQNLVEKSKKYV